ncbi:MAG: hypothetical protein ACYCYI_09425 [Saccharofermentanales bacterium]
MSEPIRLTDIRPLIDGMKGHNYALPDCMKFIFERVGVYENLSFWDIAAVTGDTVAQVYNHLPTTSCEYCVSGYLAGPEHIDYVFDAFGYDHEYVNAGEFNANVQKHLQKITDYINKGIPVLVKTNLNEIPAWESDVGTYCLLTGLDIDKNMLELLVAGTTPIQYELTDNNKLDLIFIGEKKCDILIEEIYLNAIKKMPYWLTLPEREGMFFGASAYRVWADDIEKGRFTDTNLPLWENYGVYVCNLATSGGEPTFIYGKLAELNPTAYAHFAPLGEKIQALLPAESPTGGRSKLWIQLEELGGGMDMNIVRETMRDIGKRSLIADALRDYANRLDQALELMMLV